MHGQVLTHLVRRGVEAAGVLRTENVGASESSHHAPTYVLVILGLTIGAFILLITSIRYTLWNVVSTLAMVEEPQNTFLVREEKAPRPIDASVDALPEDDIIDTEVTMIKSKPITSKIKKTIKHLTSRAGFRARWRGLSLFLVYGVAHNGLSHVFNTIYHIIAPFRVPGVNPLASILASIVLARYATAYVHIVISEPSAKPWYQRIPDAKTWKNVWAPAAVVDIATQLALVFPLLCGWLIGLDITPGEVGADDVPLIAMKILVCISLGLLSLVVLVLPACVALVRVQASMLPEEDESIVPFDRSFGGRVIPAILGGSGAIKFLDAWKTFDMAARARIIKMYAKFVVIEIGLHMFLCIVLAVEVLVLIGPDNVQRIVKDSKH